MLLLASPWASNMGVKCVSVLGGWRTATLDDKEFGPTFNKIEELWAWQRSNRYSPEFNDDWYDENSCMKVSVFVNHDSVTQQLESCEPYIENGIVYTVKAVEKPEPIVENTIDIQPTASSNDTITL